MNKTYLLKLTLSVQMMALYPYSISKMFPLSAYHHCEIVFSTKLQLNCLLLADCMQCGDSSDPLLPAVSLLLDDV